MTDRATKGPSTRAATGRRKAAAAGAQPRAGRSRPASGSAKPKPKASAAKAPAKKAAPKRKPAARKKPAAKKPAGGVDLAKAGVRVIGVTGPFGSVTLLQVPTPLAEQIFRGLDLADAAPLDVMEAVARDVAAIRERDEELAGSALAAAAMALAREISNPFNSATSKSMCAREMREHLNRLRELAPPDDEEDKVDDLARAREARRARAAGGSGT